MKNQLFTSKSIAPELGPIKPVEARTFCAIPLMEYKVQAGFPSPAEDFTEGSLDLNEYLISHPASTFHVKLTGLSMVKAGMFPGDVLIVDKADDANHGDIVIAEVDGDFTVKRLYSKNKVVKLIAENPDFPNIEFKDGKELIIWGVVQGVVRKFKG